VLAQASIDLGGLKVQCLAFYTGHRCDWRIPYLLRLGDLMIVANAHYLALLDSRIAAIHARIFDHDSQRQSRHRHAAMIRSALNCQSHVLTLRRDGLPAGLKEAIQC
jgi:hypothetical protein